MVEFFDTYKDDAVLHTVHEFFHTYKDDAVLYTMHVFAARWPSLAHPVVRTLLLSLSLFRARARAR